MTAQPHRKSASTTGRATSLSTRELGAWRGFLRAHAALERTLDHELIAAHGLPLSSYEVLLLLANAPDGRMRMCDLAEAVLLSRSGITRLADRLEADGLIERVPCETDRRGLLAVITNAGRRRLQAARPTHLAGVRERFLSRFSKAELEQLAGFWDRLLPGASEVESVTRVLALDPHSGALVEAERSRARVRG